MSETGIRGILRPVSYWRKWEQVEPELGGGYSGVAVLECGHFTRVRALRSNGYRKGATKREVDSEGRPAKCFCINCRVARECV
jgi:hypothetical protein